MELASAVPVIVGVVSFVSVEEVAKEAGASGAVVSIVMDIDEDLDDVLPTESVAVNFREYTPSSRGEEGVIEKAPSLSVVAVPKIIIPFKRVMVESASAVPVIVGVVSFVSVEVVAKEVGASGAVVSIVIEIEEDFEDILPAESVADALIE